MKSNRPRAEKHSGRRGDPVSLYPLKPDDALAALLRVNPADVKKLEQAEETKKKRAKRK